MEKISVIGRPSSKTSASAGGTKDEQHSLAAFPSLRDIHDAAEEELKNSLYLCVRSGFPPTTQTPNRTKGVKGTTTVRQDFSLAYDLLYKGRSRSSTSPQRQRTKRASVFSCPSGLMFSRSAASLTPPSHRNIPISTRASILAHLGDECNCLSHCNEPKRRKEGWGLSQQDLPSIPTPWPPSNSFVVTHISASPPE
ncbi:hypothetical protein QOT17_010582 [Balamuthia mandrillaris]